MIHSSYLVLARKWRPAQFSDIVGQTHIVRTLTNAIRSERIHQAYLFTGSRGVGKTSIARIFAKVIRCEHTQPGGSDNGQTLRSCDECFSCKEIASGNSVDVIEIDGASNNGVEAVREIRENAKYMPSSGSRKIYIIDEVHMLTTAAFNALLKTLEEPPAHVIFIFATTEPHKIPATILSRCQRFDYRRVSPSQTQNRLVEISKAEGIQAELPALALIAKAAEGSMRDALSLLDQVIAFAGSEVTAQSVRESIGLIEGQALLQILTGIFKRTPLPALSVIDQAYQQGHDLRVLTRSLIEFLHCALLAKVGAPAPAGLELLDEEWTELQAIAKLRTLEEMELIFQVLHYGLESIARSPQPKTVLDILIIKCATAEALIYLNSQPQESGPDLQKPQAEPPQGAPQSIKPAVTPTPALVLPAQKRSWEGLIEHVRKSRPLLASILEHAIQTQFPDSLSSGEPKGLAIHFSSEDAYFREQLQSRLYQEQLGHLAKEYFGRFIPIQIEMPELNETGESLAARREREQKERLRSIQLKAQNHPIILEAKSLFSTDVSPIEIKEVNARADLPA